MSGVNMSLDDIIASSRGQGRGGARRGGFVRRGGPVGNSNIKRRFGQGSVMQSGPTWNQPLGQALMANRRVLLNISNLAPTVSNADLEELFGSYDLESAVVHYGESGIPIGTGALTLKRANALRIINDFRGVAVDGHRLKLALVENDEVGGRMAMFQRVQQQQIPQTRHVGGGIQKRQPQRGSAQRGRGGQKREKKPVRTAADLDAELEAYMKK